MAPFGEDVVEAIADYMNSNQDEINLLIVQVHGGLPEATSSRLVDVGGEEVVFEAVASGENQRVIVSWSRPITRREHIRRELFELYETALEA